MFIFSQTKTWKIFSRKSIMYGLDSLQKHLDGIHDFISSVNSFKPSISFIYFGTKF